MAYLLITSGWLLQERCRKKVMPVPWIWPNYTSISPLAEDFPENKGGLQDFPSKKATTFWGAPKRCEVTIKFEPIDGSYCWWTKSCTSWYGKSPIIYRVSYTSQVVVQDFWTINTMGCWLGFLDHPNRHLNWFCESQKAATVPATCVKNGATGISNKIGNKQKLAEKKDTNA